MSGLDGSDADPYLEYVDTGSAARTSSMTFASPCMEGRAVVPIGGETVGDSYIEPPLLLLASACDLTTPDALACLRFPCSTTVSTFA